MKYELAMFVQEQVPQFYQDDAPRFITLLNDYYLWLYRKEGMTQDEVTDVTNNVGEWSSVDLDKFIATRSPRYSSYYGTNEATIAEVTQYIPPGALSDRIHAQMMLEREFDSFITADEEYYTDSTGVLVEAPFILDDAIQNWSNKFQHYRLMTTNDPNPHDEILTLKIMKMLYKTKGTIQCITLFFKIYFNDNVNVVIPKFELCVVDDIPNIDATQLLRDDSTYQEYSYIINTQFDPTPYATIFNSVYMNYFHPGGFKVILQQTPS